MKSGYFLNTFFSFLLCVVVSAQTDSVYYGQKDKGKEKDKKNKKSWNFNERLLYGGTFNFYFVNRTTVVNLNPYIGYKIHERLHAGTGFMLSYYSTRYYSQPYSNVFYGPNVWTRFIVFDGLFLQAQYDRLYQPLYNYNLGVFEKGWMDYVMAGGGFMKALGPRAFFFSSIMYNFNYKANQPSAYFNPLIQFGVVGSL